MRYHAIEEVHYVEDGLPNKDRFTFLLSCVNEPVCEMNQLLFKFVPLWTVEALKTLEDFSTNFEIDVLVKDFLPGMVCLKRLVYIYTLLFQKHIIAFACRFFYVDLSL